MSKLKEKVIIFYNKLLQLLKTGKFKVAIIIISSLFFSLYLFGENLNSKWWVIDDHEIMMFLGDDGKLSLTEIPNMLIEKTEVGDYGSYERYRPSYYTLRLVETAIWGNNPMLWYMSRILILTFFISVIWYLVWKSFDLFKGLFIVILVLSANYWVELISRLGPGETYTVLGVGLFLLGMYKQFDYITDKGSQSNKGIWKYQILIAIGAIISIGSKENFIILLIPTFLILIFAFFKKKLNLGLVITALIILLYSSFVMSSVLIAMSKTGVDIYGNTINIKDLILLTYHKIPDVLEIFRVKEFTIGIFIASFLIFVLKGKDSFKKYLKSISIFYFVVALLIGLYLSQFFFYKGEWPTGMRYDFPGMLYIPFWWINIIFIIKATLDSFEIKCNIQDKVFATIFVFVIISMSPQNNFDYQKAYTLENVSKTATFTNTINSIIEASKQNPNASIFFETYSVWDHELIVSTHRFLLANSVKNDMYINVHDYVPSTPLEEQLGEQIESVSRNGESLAGEYFTKRDNNIEKTEGCISIYMSGYEDDICNSFVIR